MPIFYNPTKENYITDDWCSQGNVLIVYKCRYEFGARLKALRKSKKLKLNEFASQIRYAADWIQRMELGYSLLTLDNLKDFADFYGVTISYLMCEEQKQEQLSFF